MHKKFDIETFNKNDSRGRVVVRSFLEADGWDVLDNPNKIGVDILAKKGNKDIECDADIRGIWKFGRFPFKTLHITARKSKYVNNKYYHFGIRNDDQAIIIARGKDLKSFTYNNNRYVKQEKVYEINTDKCTQWVIREKEWVEL